jgi:hypothetical protein
VSYDSTAQTIGRRVYTAVNAWPDDATPDEIAACLRWYASHDAGRPPRILPLRAVAHLGNMSPTAGLLSLTNRFAGVTEPAYNAANAVIWVGDGNGSVPADDPANPAHLARTALVATTNLAYAPMMAGFPAINTSNGLPFVDYAALFSSGIANFAWREAALANTTNPAGPIFNHLGQDWGGAAPQGVQRTVFMRITWTPQAVTP